MTGLVWSALHRSVVSACDAKVPFLVPGVLFGESLFETLRVREGRLFYLERHLERLRRSTRSLGWPQVARDVIAEGLATLLGDSRLQTDDTRVRITLLFQGEGEPLECLIYAAPYTPPPAAVYEAGVSALIASARVDETAVWTRVKSGHRAPYQMARRQAQSAGAWEGILVNTKGYLADGSITNVYFVHEGAVHTPSVAMGALPGIGRTVIEQICRSTAVPWQTGAYDPEMLRSAAEAFLTNALVGVVPLVHVDGHTIGDGRPGSLTQRLMAAYQDHRQRESVDWRLHAK